MNILFLCGSFYPKIGGVEKSVFSVSRELCEKGYNVSIITLNRDNSPNYESFKEGFTVYRIPPSKIPKSGMLWRWLWILFHIKLILKADIIHFHDFDVFINWFLPFRLLFFTKKYYITFHGYEGFPLRYRNILFRKFAEKLTHGNICVGEFIKRWYMTKPDVVYYAAVDKRVHTTSNETADSILFFGRFEKDTDIMSYLEALKSFYSRQNSQILLRLVGDGSLKDDVISFLENNSIHYEFCGFQNNPEIYIKRARLILTSSYLSIAESIAYGKIVIAYYSNNIKRDYLKSFPNNESLFFIMDDINKMSKKIENVLNEPMKYEAISNNGIEYANELTWDKIADKYISLYNKTNKK